MFCTQTRPSLSVIPNALIYVLLALLCHFYISMQLFVNFYEFVKLFTSNILARTFTVYCIIMMYVCVVSAMYNFDG